MPRPHASQALISCRGPGSFATVIETLFKAIPILSSLTDYDSQGVLVASTACELRAGHRTCLRSSYAFVLLASSRLRAFHLHWNGQGSGGGEGLRPRASGWALETGAPTGAFR